MDNVGPREGGHPVDEVIFSSSHASCQTENVPERGFPATFVGLKVCV